MMAKPIRALELHYPMVQFLIISIIIRLVTTSTLIIYLYIIIPSISNCS